jgi:uncharacterized protein with PIN domain
MICSCAALMTETQYARVPDDGLREVRDAQRCPKCGRVEWRGEWRKEPLPVKPA